MTKYSLTEFVEKLPNDSDDTRVAVLIFDHRINLVVPFTIVSEATKKDILASFDSIDYRGQFTNIPDAMERAIYELNTQGQGESQKSIIFITDGIVDTGNTRRDMDKTRWLRENLSEDAAEHGIKIYGIAFTNSADFELIQSLAQKTKGEYFRAFIPEEIPDVFSQIHQLIMSVKPELAELARPPSTVPTLVSEAPHKTEIENSPVEIEASSPIYVTEAPEPTPPPVKTKKIAFPLPTIILSALAVVLAIVLILLFRSRWKPSIPAPLPGGRAGVTDDPLPEALLRDVSRVTEQDMIKVGEKVTKIGRIDEINHIAIDQGTISRQHAIIEYKDHSFWISDQGSSNGTFVNGNKIVDQMRLNHGDTLAFDIYEFEFVLPGMAFDETVVDKTVFRSVHDLSEQGKFKAS